jgi:hypothetical protein
MMSRAMLMLVLPLAVVALFALSPGTLDEKLSQPLQGVSAQRPGHVIDVGGAPLPLEARMYGIFVGFAVAVASVWLRGGARRASLPHGLLAGLMLSFIVVMAVDGANALAFDVQAGALYEPRLDLRLGTGLLAGIATAAFVAPVVSLGLWRKTEPRPLFASWIDLVLALAIAGIVALGVLSDVGGHSVLSAIGGLAVLAGAWLVGAHVWVLLWHGVGQAERWSDLLDVEVAGLVIGVGLLALLAVLRTWTEAALSAG